MRAPHRLLTRLLNFTARRRGDERLREEMESHIAARTEENIRAGMTPRSTPSRRLQFGGVETIRDGLPRRRGPAIRGEPAAGCSLCGSRGFGNLPPSTVVAYSR